MFVVGGTGEMMMGPPPGTLEDLGPCREGPKGGGEPRNMEADHSPCQPLHTFLDHHHCFTSSHLPQVVSGH